MRSRIGLLAMLLALTPGIAHADTITCSGFLNDPGNGALFGSDLGSPLFGDDWEVALNVAIYQLNLPAGGNTTFDLFQLEEETLVAVADGSPDPGGPRGASTSLGRYRCVLGPRA